MFHFYGGHRLWYAPEEPARTYLPDDFPVEASRFENGFTVTQQTEPATGLQKSIQIELEAGLPRATLTHRIANRSPQEVTCALWAITQFRTGGLGIFPQARTDTGVLPNRRLSLWPYTDMMDPNVHWGSSLILVRAGMTSPFKFGFPNPRGWQAYWLDGTLFVKRAAYDPRAAYYDYGSSSECYCSERFIELETLAPVTTLAPGATAAHTETWELHAGVDCPRGEAQAQALVTGLGLA
jgi:hypothetical protein